MIKLALRAARFRLHSRGLAEPTRTQTLDQFPRALAKTHGVVAGSECESGSFGLGDFGGFQQGAQKAEAVGSGIAFQRLLGQFRKGGENVDKRNELGMGAPCSNSTRPADDEGHAMTCLPHIRFHASPSP